MIDIEQPMIRIRLYREGGRYVKLANNKKKEKKERKRKIDDTCTIADEQPSTLGVPDFRSLGLQESIEVITKHSSEGIHLWPLWLQDRHGQLL
jgi:hypothetical protein